MKSAVITGPTGTVGMALIQKLSEAGVHVTAVCRQGSLRMGRIPRNENISVVECSLDQLKSLPALIGEKQEVFYHFGWDGTFGDSRNDVYGQNLNVKYTLDAVEAAAALGCHTFVGAGSQAEYGRHEGALKGSTPVFPESGYGVGKLCAGLMSRIACGQKGIRHVWARILSVYGPYDGEYTMIMSTIRKLLRGEVPALTGGEQQWDYLYSRDAAEAMRLLGEKGRDGGVYCIGSGQARPLREYIEILRDEVDKELSLGFGEIPYGDNQVMYLCADITDLHRDTGFVPQYTFREGIQNTIAWYKENYG